MKSCPRCQRVFPNEAGFCPEDGAELRATSMVPLGPDADPRIGSKLCDRYQIRRVVADGGMGRVYEGVDKATDTRIAVKVLHESVVEDAISLERFKREYEISAKLPHDHIVKVLDFQKDPTAETWLLVMEFLDGEELRHILKRDKYLPPARLVRMLSQVAIGLDGAHAKDFVHRDLKPDNLFLCGTREGDICKILDFGSVKDKRDGSKKLTMMGTTIGSPFYMAPEQAQGLDSLDARADVFSLAAVAYECITGTIPFNGTNGPSILLAILTKDPLPLTIAGKGSPYPIPPRMDDVFEEALAKNAKIRTKSVGELADAIGHAYGLTGGHLDWATLPQGELESRIAKARALASSRAVEADPFAASAPPSAAVRGMNEAFEAARENDLQPAGLGGGRPAWVLPVAVGVGALAIGGALAFLLMK